MNRPNAILTIPVNPKSDMGRLRALSPYHTSLILPPTILIETDDAPPRKRRSTAKVAKFRAKADGKKEITRIKYETKEPGMRPDDSVSGTKMSGQIAVPIFQEVAAQAKFGNGSF